MPLSRDHATLVRIAKLHFEGGHTQREIAKLYGTSISTISRALQQARDVGIVQIRVHESVERVEKMERALVSRFGLLDAIVVPAADSRHVSLNSLGHAVASYLELLLHDAQIIGVSDGSSTSAVALHLRSFAHKRSQVVPLLGGVGEPNVDTHPGEVARALARKIGGHSRQFNAPAIVQDPATRRALVADPSIRSILAIVERCEIALVGMGAVYPIPTLHHVLTPAVLEEAQALQAVGAICARFFDAAGQPIASVLDERTIGITLSELKQIGHSIGIAAGIEKVEVVRAALRGHLVNVLATDQDVAWALLDSGDEDEFDVADMGAV